MLWIAISATLSCTSGTADLRVEIRTDLVPGLEFSAARVTLSDGQENIIAAHAGTRWIEEPARSSFSWSTPPGTVQASVELLHEGAVTLVRHAVVEISGRTAITFNLTRTCIGVSCAEGQTCRGGSCIDAVCSATDNAPLCRDTECAQDSDCEDLECAAQGCRAGGCWPIVDQCPENSFCVGDMCQPIIGTPTADAGPVLDGNFADAIVDAGLQDSAQDAALYQPPLWSPDQCTLFGASCEQTRVTYMKGLADGRDRFGDDLDISANGQRVVVGLPHDDSGSLGFGGDPADDSNTDSGAVVVLAQGAAGWELEEFIKAPRDTPLFGAATALSADGRVMAAASLNEVFSYSDDGAQWLPLDPITMPPVGSTLSERVSEDQGRQRLALDHSGQRLALGLARLGRRTGGEPTAALRIYHRDGNAWMQAFEATRLGEVFAHVVAMSNDGNTVAAGAMGAADPSETLPAAGAVYLYTRAGNEWTEAQVIRAPFPSAGARFGSGVALSADGTWLAIGASDESGGSAGINRNQLSLTSQRSGAVYVYRRTQGDWQFHAYIKAAHPAAGDSFGASVALSNLGDMLVVGAPDENGGDSGLQGDPESRSLSRSGAAYLFARGPNAPDGDESWQQQAYLKAAAPHAIARFGTRVAIAGDGTTILVGHPNESGSGIGINPEFIASTNGRGAVYAYEAATP